MKIDRYYNQFVIRIPCETERCNPYDDRPQGTMPTLVGLIDKTSSGHDEIGFAYNIDMQYKGKGDQYTDIRFHWDGSEDGFREKCRELGIEVIELIDDFGL